MSDDALWACMVSGVLGAFAGFLVSEMRSHRVERVLWSRLIWAMAELERRAPLGEHDP